MLAMPVSTNHRFAEALHFFKLERHLSLGSFGKALFMVWLGLGIRHTWFDLLFDTRTLFSHLLIFLFLFSLCSL